MAPEGFPSDSVDLLRVGLGAIHVLVVDVDRDASHDSARSLSLSGCMVATAASTAEAGRVLESQSFDVIIADPGARVASAELLQIARARDADVQVIMMTESPEVDSAVLSIELRAFGYLTKPFAPGELEAAVSEAAHFRREQRARRMAMERLQRESESRRAMRASLAHALDSLFLEYQPIVEWTARRVFAYEALLRTLDRVLATPIAVLTAAERLGLLPFVSRAVRKRLIGDLSLRGPDTAILFNLHASDLLDESLFDPAAPFSAFANRIVLEITERASLHDVTDLRARIDRLRALGFRIAIDDLGEGYAGLTSVATIEPEVMKLDMTIVRGVERSRSNQRLIRSMIAVAREAGAKLVAEGVETVSERDALVELGCEFMQGFLFARPGDFPEVAW
jgi:EAL domain-containing protein (putative c-di-GMP-specific phosphodiesterase class I)